jgi:hypothetical protein
MRKFHWFNHYIWGYSKSYEDFFRNPAEVLLDEQLCLKDVWGVTLLCCRFGFDRCSKRRRGEVYLRLLEYFSFDTMQVTQALEAIKRLPFENVFDFGRNQVAILDKVYTRYPNAYFSINLVLCVKRSFPLMMLPGLYITWRFSPHRYAQTGWGFAPRYRESPWQFKLGGLALRPLTIMSYKSDLKWNPGSIAFEYEEGGC